MTNLRNERKIISVPVLESDARYAERHDRWACAIVRAIQRERPEALRVRVDTDQISFTEGKRRYFFPTPEEAIEKIIKPFDEQGTFEPGTVRLARGTSLLVRDRSERQKAAMRDHRREQKAVGNPCYEPGRSRKTNRFLPLDEPADG